MNRGLPEIHKLRRAMRKAGAVSPEKALPAMVFNDIIESDIDPYVDAEILKESPSGGFYLDESNASRAFRNQLIKLVSFWLLVVLIPVIILQFAR